MDSLLTGLIIGFIVGSLSGGLYCAWFIKKLRNNNYIKIETTDKFKKEFSNK